MTEIVYAKKRLQPLIEKFGINPETDKVFQSIMHLFNAQTDYQMWGLKLIYTHATTLDDLIHIKEWADANPTEISNLSLKNLVSYKNVADIAKLHKEISSLDAYHFVKNIMNTFNTDQRKLLKKDFLDPIEEQPWACLSHRGFKVFYENVSVFQRLPEHRKRKFITLMSAVRSSDQIIKHLKDAINETYEWNREDLLSYAQRNCPDAEICYDDHNVVILRLDSFKTAQKLCGSGRTAWCITRDNSYFKRYTDENNGAAQFALFDFNLKEDHELAHVGFSVRPDRGINYAHSTRNHSMMDGIEVDGSRWDIHKLLNNRHQIPRSAYVRLRKLQNYKWDKKEFLKKLANYEKVEIIEMEDGRIIVPIGSNTLKNFLIEHTLINNTPDASSHMFFAVLDFSKEYNDERSLLLLTFAKDLYGSLSIKMMYEPFGQKITDMKKIREYGLDESFFISSTPLGSNVLLHKYIDEDNIDAAIKLLNEAPDIDPNHVFFNTLPITKSIMKEDSRLFTAITSHPKFDMDLVEAFGEPYAQFALMYMQSFAKTKNKDTKPYIDMCMSLLTNERYDNNRVDPINDTILHTACESGEEALPIVEYLVNDPNTNVNVINMWGYAPIDTAIETRNIGAIKLLLSNPNTEVRKVTLDLAASMGIDLKGLVSQFGTKESKTSREYEDAFAKAFSSLMR